METYSCNTFKGYDCDNGTKKCVSNPYPGPNQPCAGTTGKYWCSGGATCVVPPSQQSGTCMKAVTEGATCSNDNGPDCVSPAECINGKCAIVDAAICK